MSAGIVINIGRIMSEQNKSLLVEWLATFGRKEGVIERCVIPATLISVIKYVPQDVRWRIHLVMCLWLSIMIWKLVIILKGKQWR